MICYAETSAVLAWIHGEPEGPAVLRVLRAARRVIASRLTLFGCDRVLRRRVREGDLAERQAGPARALLAASAGQWDVLTRAHDAEPTKVLPVRVPAATVAPLDEDRRRLRLRSRSEMIHKAMAAFLINAGESDLAGHFGATFTPDDADAE